MYFNITKIKMCSVGLYSIFLRLNRYLKCSILMVSAGFAPWRIRPHIDSSSDQVLQIYLSHTEKKKTTLCARWNKTCLFLILYPLKVTDELEIESLGWGRTLWENSPWGETGINHSYVSSYQWPCRFLHFKMIVCLSVKRGQTLTWFLQSLGLLKNMEICSLAFQTLKKVRKKSVKIEKKLIFSPSN